MSDDKQVIGLYQSGLSLRDVGTLTDRSHEAVRYTLRKHGVEVRRRGLNLRYTASRAPSVKGPVK